MTEDWRGSKRRHLTIDARVAAINAKLHLSDDENRFREQPGARVCLQETEGERERERKRRVEGAVDSSSVYFKNNLK